MVCLPAVADTSPLTMVDGELTLALQPSGSQTRAFILPKSDIDVQMAPRLIIRASPNIMLNEQLLQLQAHQLQLLTSYSDDDIVMLLPLASASSTTDILRCAREVAAMAGVRYAIPDLLFTSTFTASPYPYYDLDNFRITDALPALQTLWQQAQGEGVNVAVIDDGFQMTHRDWQHTHIINPALATGPSMSPRQHGAEAAGVIFAAHSDNQANGIAPNANLIAIQLRGGWTSELLMAFDDAVQSRADIISASWIVPYITQPLREFISHHSNAKDSVLFVVAAGNRNVSHQYLQALANQPDVITVAAADHRLQPLATQLGVKVDLYAPSMLPTPAAEPDKELTFIGGSSGATPVIAGIAALLKSQQPQLSASQLKQLLIATDAKPPIINLPLVVEHLRQQPQVHQLRSSP